MIPYLNTSNEYICKSMKEKMYEGKWWNKVIIKMNDEIDDGR